MKHLGRSPHDELVRLRVQHARALLADTDMPVATIARKAGFQQTARLSRTFLSVTGQTPTEYRKQLRPHTE